MYRWFSGCIFCAILADHEG